MVTLKQVCDRLPIELVPDLISDSSVLSAIARLKTERNNALAEIEDHNKMRNRHE